MWPLRYFLRVMRKHDLTNNKTITNTKRDTKKMTNTFRGCSHITSAKSGVPGPPLPPSSAMVSICHTSGLEQQIRPFSGLFLDNGPDRDKVRKLGLLRKHCFNIYRSLSACINWGNFFMNKSFQSPHINVACFCEEGVSSEGGGFNTCSLIQPVLPG